MPKYETAQALLSKIKTGKWGLSSREQTEDLKEILEEWLSEAVTFLHNRKNLIDSVACHLSATQLEILYYIYHVPDYVSFDDLHRFLRLELGCYLKDSGLIYHLKQIKKHLPDEFAFKISESRKMVIWRRRFGDDKK